jgi:prefoldin subunit 5
MTDNTEAQLARLDERLNSIEKSLAAIAEAQREASAGRRRGYEAQERTEREIIGITHRLSAVEKAVDAIRPTTTELERVRDRVVFAGSLGKALWAIGKAVLAAAAGAAAVYYSLTGRPPP